MWRVQCLLQSFSSKLFSAVVLIFFVFNINISALPECAPCQTLEGVPGICVPVPTCPPLKKLLEQAHRIPEKLALVTRKYKCSETYFKPRVCCTFDPRIPPPENVSNHSKLHLLPENCGISETTSRIHNGNATGPLDYPWMALLGYKSDDEGRLSFLCGGSVISQRYILTAAHCVVNTKNPLIAVRVGDHDLRTESDCYWEGTGSNAVKTCPSSYQDLKVEEIIPHPRYNVTELNGDDIALLRVAPINLAVNNVKPICLPTTVALGTYNLTNRSAIVTGWGVTEQAQPSPVLLKAELPIIANEECRCEYRLHFGRTIQHKQMCAGKAGSDSCMGDSGGPLQFIASHNDDIRYIQQAVVSFGISSKTSRVCDSKYPGVYTRVAYYLPWILESLKP